MKIYSIVFVLLFLSVNSLEEGQKNIKRLTYKETFDPENSYYVLNTEDEYKTIKNLEKSELIKNSSTYTYEWNDHETKQYLNLKDLLPPGDSEGYRDMTKYDFIYLNIYSKNNIGSKIIIVIECQKRTPDEISQMKVCYKNYIIPINFEGWKEIKIPYSILGDGYGGDLTKVSSLIINSNGWGCVPNKDTDLFIDKIIFTKIKIVFNMEESEILERDYSSVIDRFRYSLINSGSLINEKNENIVKRLKEIVKTASKTYNSFNKDGLPFSTSMQDTQNMNEIYYKLRQLAMGYAIEGGEYNKNKDFLNDIINALDYMHDNYYTKRSQKIFSGFDNWWNWDIGIPQALVEILVYLKDELSQEQIDKYLKPVNEYIPLPSMTMANRADIAYSCIIAGVLQKNYTRIVYSVELLRELFDKVEQGDGFYDDGSFIQHNVYAYIGGYGSALLGGLSKIVYSLDESCFMFDDEMKENQYWWISEAYLPFIYDGAFYDLVRGRGVDRNPKGLSTGINVISSLFFISKYIKDENNLKFIKSYLKYVHEKDPSFYNNSLLIGTLGILEEIIQDTSIKTDNMKNNFSKVFSRMDKAVAQLNGIGLGISLSSTRTGKYESINEENKKGWYQGDGMTYIYLSPNDYASSYWPYINYYRLPGTTISNAPREAKVVNGKNTLGKYDFVGGAYMDINMVVAMKFASELSLCGFSSSLVGNKGYFIFDNIFVFIGNSINCSDDYEIETIIENKKLNGKFYFGDKEITEKSGKVNSNYIYIENYGGIYIPDYSNAKYEVTNNEFLEIYFDHGKKIKDESYTYYIIPKIEKNELEKYVTNIDIISENNKITAVKDKLNNIFEYIFWEKGSINDIQVDNPCTLIINEKEKEFSISDPTQKLENINVSFGSENYDVKVSKGYSNRVKFNS